MNEPIIRLSRPTDINNIVTLDLKCYVYPLSLKDWQSLVNESGQKGAPRVVMLEAERKPIGFAMWQYSKKADITVLIRLGVLPKFRGLGMAKILLHACYQGSKANGIGTVQVVAPEIHCRPGDPDDISEFLLKVGFKPTGKILNDYKEMYGDQIDGYVFEREIKNDTKRVH